MKLATSWSGWRSDSWRWIGGDLAVGLVLASLLVPAGLGYAEAAGLPAISGLYATVIPLVIYALIGPSRSLVLGPDSSINSKPVRPSHRVEVGWSLCTIGPS